MKKFFLIKSKNENNFEDNSKQNFKLETKPPKHMVKSESTTGEVPTPIETSYETVALKNFKSVIVYPALTEDHNNKERWTRLRERFQQNIWWRHLLAGGLAGAISRTTTAPMDRVKIYTQVHPHQMGIIGCLKHLIQKGGVLSLWRGNGVNVLKIVPESSIKFTAYEKIKRLIRGDDSREMALRERFLAGAAAGGLAQTFIYPLEVLKVRLASQLSGEYSGLRDAARKMYYQEGLHSFYRGYVPNILGCVPYGGIEFTVYEALKRKYIGYNEEAEFFVLVSCSCISSIVGQCCVYPLALARTRLQSGIVGDTGLINIFRVTFRNEGFKGLYRGLIPNICKVVPAVSINFVVYEYVSRYLGINMT